MTDKRATSSLTCRIGGSPLPSRLHRRPAPLPRNCGVADPEQAPGAAKTTLPLLLQQP
jgi:hypothetical protein